MPRVGPGLVTVGVLLGLASEFVAFDVGAPGRWIPDLAVGLGFLVAGASTWSRARGAGGLLAATGLLWFLANVEPAALYWHRGTLVHLLLCLPNFRARSPVTLGLVLLGYAAALFAPVWGEDRAVTALGGTLILALVGERAGAAGPRRRHATVALQAGVVLAAALIGGALARLAGAPGDAVVPALWVYQGALLSIAIGLYLGVRRDVRPAVTDLVVELGEASGQRLRDALAKALGDPSLQVGYPRSDGGGYVDEHGAAVRLPTPGDRRAATFITKGERRSAVLLHDRAILADPDLMTAVEAATLLSAANAALHTELRDRVAEVTASRHRLVLAADEERRRLEDRLHQGAERRLNRMRATLGSAAAAGASDHLHSATEQLDQTIEELHLLAQGLHPRELSDGLIPALRALARRNPVPVRVSAADERYPPDVEVAVYYACAEGLSNATKHAGAKHAGIDVSRRASRLVIDVFDDGAGGADAARGTGLAGVAARVEALGGRLTIQSAPAAGTHLTVYLPLA